MPYGFFGSESVNVTMLVEQVQVIISLYNVIVQYLKSNDSNGPSSLSTGVASMRHSFAESIYDQFWVGTYMR